MSNADFTTHEILDATAFVSLSSVATLTGPRRDKRVVAVRRLFIATARSCGKNRSMIARILKRDRTSILHQEQIIARMDANATASLQIDVSRVQMELRRRANSICAMRLNTKQGTHHNDT